MWNIYANLRWNGDFTENSNENWTIQMLVVVGLMRFQKAEKQQQQQNIHCKEIILMRTAKYLFAFSKR